MTRSAAVVQTETLKADQPSVGEFLRKNAVGLAIALGAFVLLFWPAINSLVFQWRRDPDFSHGFLIPVISGVILFAHRKKLLALPARRSNSALILLALSILLFIFGILVVSEIAKCFGLLGAFLGSVWFLLGSCLLREKLFPFLFLVFCIPPPAFIFTPLRLELKGFATRVSADVLQKLGLPAAPHGNILQVGDVPLEVADACSGIRSLMAIAATAVLFAYLFRTGLWKGLLLTLTALPVTLANNIVRVVIVSVALVKFDIDLTSGLRHDLLGLAVYGVTLVSLYLIWRFYEWLFRWEPRERTSGLRSGEGRRSQPRGGADPLGISRRKDLQ